ncbi:MAG: lytic murein transglycosylase B [Thiolinea sp.]
MQSGRLLLTGLILTSCVGVMSGCSSAPAKDTKAVQAKASKQPEVVHEYIIKHAPKESPAQVARALPLTKNNVNYQPSAQAAAKNRQVQLRLKRQREWAAKQLEEEKRAEYRKKWEQKQAQAKAQQLASAQQQQAQRAAQEKRQQYHQKWQQEQAKRQRYQQQAQARQRNNAKRQQQVVTGYGGRGTGNYRATQLAGDFAGNPKLIKFIENMSARHGFSRSYLYGVFSQTRNRDVVARLWAGNGGGKSSGRGWYNYRSKFVTPGNIQKGQKFWRQYRPHIMRASQRYGVDPEYIVGIMGVETRWGRILGKHRVIDALTTSAIVNKRRSRFFFKELENYLIMTRSERMDPLQPKGSYAGAMGYGQFMPSSFRAFAVDFNGDGVRDLWNPVDAIGSIANYFAKHGWKRGQEVAVPAKVTSMAYTKMPDGYKVKYSRSRLAKKGIRPRSGRWSRTGRTHLLALTTVPGGLKEPWIGYHNFYVITRYNHSNYYAMAVHQLARAVKRKMGGGQYASR